jgi:UDP-N-acetylmuramoylalanine-D-glutamate ligase
MSEDLINLTKQVKITLKKRAAPTITAQVGVSFDISGSTQSYYGTISDNNNSYIQKLVNRIFAIAVMFDDNGALNTWVFDSCNSQIDDIVESNYETYVIKNILKNNKIHKWGSTNFHSVIADINEYYNLPELTVVSGFAKLKSVFSFGKPKIVESTLSDPAYILFITDGESDNDDAAEAAIKKTKDDRIYWQFAGIDNGNNYEFLKLLANKLPNVSYELISPTTTTDAELYDKLISVKFVNWYTALPK